MIYSILESSINSALELDENFDENGNINWDYIHADAYADVRSFFKDDEMFNEFFDDIVDGIIGEMDEAAFQYEMMMPAKKSLMTVNKGLDICSHNEYTVYVS